MVIIIILYYYFEVILRRGWCSRAAMFSFKKERATITSEARSQQWRHQRRKQAQEQVGGEY